MWETVTFATVVGEDCVEESFGGSKAGGGFGHEFLVHKASGSHPVSLSCPIPPSFLGDLNQSFELYVY